ncbi:putative MFS family arabinose efflux permease [Actinocorallia herbida]|uniref:Putative MFS family arabinose efflux permease n=1 Tax=Actinocorallia herbida TaxID=58109 RepID=A0A3N1D5D9_9ACTN|nr:MFS transporter [Actinocorallia herbida]ROO88699.1 putative MFS family arabinose efflux permease [Actinocorallia herbida]
MTATQERAARPATTAPGLWTRNFTLYFGARVVSLFGDAMMPVAAALAVGRLYGISGVGYVMAVWTGSVVLFLLVGGVLADKVGARAMMVGADAVRFCAQGAVAVAFLTGTPSMGLLLATSLLSGVATAMFQPGVNGMVPLVAADPQRANAVLKIADAGAQVAGPVLAGTLIALTDAGVAYTVDAATFLISGLFLALIRGLPAAAKRVSAFLPDLREGWREFRARSWMWSVIIIWVFFGLLVFGPSVPLGARLVGDRLGEAAYGWVMAALGLGTVVGGLTAMVLRPARPLAAGGVALFGYTLVPLTLALQPALPWLMAGHLVGGAAWAFWSVMWSTSVQTQVPYAVLNRITAYEVAGSVSGLAVGQALVGAYTLVLEPRDLLLVSAVTTLAVAAAVLLTRPVRRLRAVPAKAPES